MRPVDRQLTQFPIRFARTQNQNRRIGGSRVNPASVTASKGGESITT
jgi:hypothetical protein